MGSNVNEAVSGAHYAPPPRRLIYRHSVVVRITHWINVVCLTILLMSGLQIFNAHPALYWGNLSDFDHPILEMTSEQPENGAPKGITTVFGHRIDTTGVLGLSRDPLAVPGRVASRPGSRFRASSRWRRGGCGTSSSPGSSFSTAPSISRPASPVGISAGICFRHGTISDGSGGRHGITCCSASRRARKPAATTFCRSSLIWWSSWCSCR